MCSAAVRAAITTILFFFAAASVAQEVGDVLAVNSDAGAELRRGDRAIETLPRGCPVRLRKIEKDRYFVRSWAGRDWSLGEQGWLDQAAVSRPQETINRLSAAIKKNPTAADYTARGLSRIAAGTHDEAALDLTEALKLTPDNAAALLYRSIAEQSLGQADQAAKDRREALRLAPDWYLAHVTYGAEALAMGEARIAYKSFTKAIELAPGRANLHFLRGIAAGRGLAYEGATADFEEAIRLDPEHAGAYAFRGFNRFLLSSRGGSRPDIVEKALADLSEAIRLEPQEDRFKKMRESLARLAVERGARDGSRPPVEAAWP